MKSFLILIDFKKNLVFRGYLNFCSNTVYSENKVEEKNILSIYDTKSVFSNTLYPNSKVLGLNIKRINDKTIDLTSRYGNNAVSEDVGTVENFIHTVNNIKQGKIAGLSPDFDDDVNKNVSDNNKIFIGNYVHTALEKFKNKYAINNLSGNVIIYANNENK